MKKYKLAILDCNTLGKDINVRDFENFGELGIYSDLDKDELFKVVEELDIIITNKVRIDKELLDRAKNLKMVAITATGYNNVDLDYAREKNVSIYNVGGYSTKSVAQHTMAMALSMVCRIIEMDRYIKSGDYSRSKMMTRLKNPIMQISEMQWGIIGMGDIGKEVAKIANTFGASIKYFSPSEKNLEYERVSLEKLLETSDIVSIHCPLNDSTNRLIDYDRLKTMKKNAIIINVARGGIIVEEDLARAISEDIIQGACLDVFEKEPIDSDNPLLKVDSDRILMTPHTAWSSVEARKNLVREVYLNVESFVNGGERKPL